MRQAPYFQTTLSRWLCRFRNIQLVSLLLRTRNTEYPCFFLSGFPSIRAFIERVFRKIFWMLLGYTVAKAPASPRNSTWFTRPFLLVRGWGLGTRLVWSMEKVSSAFYSAQNLKRICTFLWQPRGLHFTLANQISTCITQFSHFSSNQSDFSSVKLQKVSSHEINSHEINSHEINSQ